MTYARKINDYTKIIDDYRQTLSFAETAKKFGVSRERIRQLVNKFIPDLRPTRGWKRATECKLCGVKKQEVKKLRGYYCSACFQAVESAAEYKLGAEQYWKNRRQREEWKKTIYCLKCGKDRRENKKPNIGFRGLCYHCYLKWEYNKHLAQRKVYQRTYWRKHKDKVSERNRKYYLAHKEELRIYHLEYARKNKEKIKLRRHIYTRNYRLKNIEKINAYRRRYYQRKKVEKSPYI